MDFKFLQLHKFLFDFSVHTLEISGILWSFEIWKKFLISLYTYLKFKLKFRYVIALFNGLFVGNRQTKFQKTLKLQKLQNIPEISRV